MTWLRDGEVSRIPLDHANRIAEIAGRNFGLQFRDRHNGTDEGDVHILDYGTPTTWFQLLWTRDQREFDVVNEQVTRYVAYLASETPPFVRTGDWG